MPNSSSRPRLLIRSLTRWCIAAIMVMATLSGAGLSSVHAATSTVSMPGGTRVAIVGNSTAQRMSLFGNFETMLHLRTTDQPVVVRNFGWPADEVGIQLRPGNYTEIDDPLTVYAPQWFVCFFGFNESFAGDSPEQIAKFQTDYNAYLDKLSQRFATADRPVGFLLVTPMAFESTGHPLQPTGELENRRLEAYAKAVAEVARQRGLASIDVFTPTRELFQREPGNQYTVNGIHLNEQGDQTLALLLDAAMFDGDGPDVGRDRFERVRELVNDKSWLHQQDYRMLNGWYVYGGRRTWDTETFPGEYQKIRKMVGLRDDAIWKLAAGRIAPDANLAAVIDDASTGEVFIPETMFGSRDDNFREMREPKTLVYPTPEESIAQMTVPNGFVVEEFASERDFPELANPTQIAFDDRGRLWVSCMVNYPQWLPGASRPNDRLLILEDTDGDGKADTCKPFYNELICPTGFEFYKDGVLVVDEPHVLFLRDTDGDDVADEVTHLLDGIGTDDTHHAMGAWEYSNGGRLHMLEGIALSTTLETPWGPFRRAGASGSYVWDLESQRITHFKTPGQYNPWCLVFDQYGNGIVGDGTNAQHHWTSALSGGDVQSRKSLDPIFNNHGIRPAAGNEILRSRALPESVHNQLIFACVINIHGMPAFELRDSEQTAAPEGQRVDDLLTSTDMFFRPVDPKIGPDGALYFGDWCNALIGHMQYSQRDPNRDHEHGRIYRLRHKELPLLEPQTPAGKTIDQQLDQLLAYEPRTRYRARRALRTHAAADVSAAIQDWLTRHDDPQAMLEALWVQESFHAVDLDVVDQVLARGNFQQRAAAVHVLGNQWSFLTGNQRVHDRSEIVLSDDDRVLQTLTAAMADPHPRVRVETLRAASLIDHPLGLKLALSAVDDDDDPAMDKWTAYVMEHTISALKAQWTISAEGTTADVAAMLASLSPRAATFLEEYQIATGPGAEVYRPLKVLANVDAEATDQAEALQQVIAAKPGNPATGANVFNRVCAACHQHGDLGKAFGPNLTGLGDRMATEHVIRSIVWPNEEISKGYETIMVLTADGEAVAGFVLKEDDDAITLGIADGKTRVIDQEEIEVRKEMKASSMPEGLTETIGPGEFLDLLAFLTRPWVPTNPNLDYMIRGDGENTEVTRDSMVRLGDDFPSRYNNEAQHLLSGEGVRSNTFAIHSANRPTNNPSVVVRLSGPCELVRGEIQNRDEPQFHDRAKGLTMWVSDDGETWTEVWKAESPAATWQVTLPPGTAGRYVKFGLDGKGILHLNRIVLYGQRK